MRTSGLVLILNSGSSSLKFAVIDPETGEESLNGISDALDTPAPSLEWRYCGEKQHRKLHAGAGHSAVIDSLVDLLRTELSHLTRDLIAVGHRVVHGGEHFSQSVLIDDDVIETIAECSELAPLHNPAGLLGIRKAQLAFPQLPQVAVFDTAFHHSLPEHAYLYALPYSLYRDYRIRRYGMHGISHSFVSARAAQLLNIPLQQINIISAHLGNGASIAAIKDGVSIDTSMGLTPLEGLVMGSRCGDVDPGVLLHLGEALGYGLEQLKRLLNRQSGLLGISELSSDCRELENAAAEGHRGARIALEIFCYRLAKYVAAYHVPLPRVDAVVFTGGIGENSSWVRERVLRWLQSNGYTVDASLNERVRFGAEGRITAAGDPVALVIPTNEEWVIARDTAALVEPARG